jgi:hypothetical protein
VELKFDGWAVAAGGLTTHHKKTASLHKITNLPDSTEGGKILD